MSDFRKFQVPLNSLSNGNFGYFSFYCPVAYAKRSGGCEFWCPHSGHAPRLSHPAAKRDEPDRTKSLPCSCTLLGTLHPSLAPSIHPWLAPLVHPLPVAPRAPHPLLAAPILVPSVPLVPIPLAPSPLARPGLATSWGPHLASPLGAPGC